MTNAFAVTSAEAGIRKSCGQANSSSPRKRGPRSKRPKSLGSRFRGNDGYVGERTPTVLTCGTDNIELP